MELTHITPTPEVVAAAKEVADLRKQIAGFRRQIGEVLQDDLTDADAASAKLASVRCKEELLSARLARRTDGLKDAVCAAYRAEHAAAEMAVAAAQQALADCKARWESTLTQSHGLTGARTILRSLEGQPLEVRAARTALETAEKRRNALHATRRLLDEAYELNFKPRPGEEWRACEPYRAPDFANNIERVIAEMGAETDQTGGLIRKAVRRITGLTTAAAALLLIARA
jgi:hypothetical protein